MASPDISPVFEYQLRIYGCTKANNCVLEGTRSCPMNQEVVVKTGLAPKRIRRVVQVDTTNATPFYEGVREVGLIRRITRHQQMGSLPQDMASRRENGQFKCDKVLGKRGNVFVNAL